MSTQELVGEPDIVSAASSADRRGIFGWLSYQGALQPIQSVVMSFVFAPYFASRIAADGVEGQSLWGLVTATAGIIIAVVSPVLGAIADRGGAMKPWLAMLSACIVLGCLALLLADTDGATPIAIILSAVVVIAICADFARILGDSLMTRLVPVARLGQLSG
jgi:UMF1 family MFS transporter